MPKQIKIEVSARHVHLSREDMDILFGYGSELTKMKDLSQLGEFASEEKVDLIAEDKELKGVRIVGPIRENTQVELSQTDARSLKINAPLRISGDLNGAALIKIVGPKGEVVKNVVIVAKRHMHCTPETAEELKLQNGQIVKVKAGKDGARGLILDNVVVRVSEKFVDMVHVDTDEGNAFSVNGEDMTCEILD